MKMLKIILGVLVGFVALYFIFYPAVRVNYRLTLEVETPEGLATGSGVIGVSYSHIPQLWATSSLSTGLVGEAVHVDLGSRGTLYALLTGRTADGQPGGPPPSQMLTKVMDPEVETVRSSWQRVVRRAFMSGKKDVPLELIPFLVRFWDEADPKTVEAVDPSNLAASFGEGVRLVRVTIEMVPAGWWPLSLFSIGGEPVTRGIEKRLQWLPEYYEKHLDGDRYHTLGAQNRLANSLGSGSFRTRGQ